MSNKTESAPMVVNQVAFGKVYFSGGLCLRSPYKPGRIVAGDVVLVRESKITEQIFRRRALFVHTVKDLDVALDEARDFAHGWNSAHNSAPEGGGDES